MGEPTTFASGTSVRLCSFALLYVNYSLLLLIIYSNMIAFSQMDSVSGGGIPTVATRKRERVKFQSSDEGIEGMIMRAVPPS